MSWRLTRYTQELKKHDPCLFAVESAPGAVQVWRKAGKWEASELFPEESGQSQPIQFITALTDTWKPDGIPVDRGIEPLMFKIRQMDTWNRGPELEAMRNRREKEKEDKKRQNKNEIMARAADLRKDFAKAVNDINTSSLDMTDARRKYGNC